MNKYKSFKDIPTHTEYKKYRMDIFTGKCKGIYMYDTLHEERNWFIKMGDFIEEKTEIFFMEKLGESNNYEVKDYIVKE